MKKRQILLFCLMFTNHFLFCQIRGAINQMNSLPDDNQQTNPKLNGKIKYTDYKVISFKNDTTYIDTTLSIKKEYKFNFLTKDNFGLLPFHNQGQTFNTLTYDFSNLSLVPDIGFRAKQFSYFNLQDIKYYQVPTPTTQILYRTGLEQGQVLDALFTLNFSKRLNFAIAYKGLRSLGKYQRSLSSQGNFRTSFHYQTKKGEYAIRGHILVQDITNQENGGLTPQSLNAFKNDDPLFSKNQGRLDVNLKDAENVLDTKRYYFEHTFKLLSTKDSLHQNNFTNLKLGHSFLLENKFYKFKQQKATKAIFGPVNTVIGIENITDYQFTSNQLFLDFNSKYILGRFRIKSNYSTYTYGYKGLENKNIYTVDTSKLKGKSISFGADWNAQLKAFDLHINTNITPGKALLSGIDFRGEIAYKKDGIFTLGGSILINQKFPNFNFLLFQSSYNNYNWQNDFKKINTRDIGIHIKSKWGNAFLNFTNIDNYTYFDTNNKPKQTPEHINYLKLKIFKEFTIGKFALDNTVLYQNVSSGSYVFRIPEVVTRNTFYYTDSWFKGKPLFVQIGITFNYFSKYKMNAYNPILSEFTLQNSESIGYPTFDMFFNARVRRTRIYFKIDNLTSGFSKKNYFSAPNYPYRGFVIRFGVVWNWFI